MNFQIKRPPKTEFLQSLAVTNPHLFLIGLQDVLNFFRSCLRDF
nr:MAG TPA: hypothetical protein [Bacteriophage sp.]